MAAGYILLAAAGVTAIGLFISTLTDSGPGAIVGTVIVAIASQVLDQIPSLHAYGFGMRAAGTSTTGIAVARRPT